MTDVVAGRYALVDPIAAGGFGTVWRAFDQKTGRYCAAKLLRQRDAGELLRFVREQSVRLSHPNIVGPYSWAAEDGTVLIASELVAGGSVHTLLGDWGPLAEGTVVTIVRQLLAALQAVHDAELIHRDVKPANLLLHATGTGSLQLALTDFGLTISRRDARLTQIGMVIGTPGYLPPEVLAGGVPPDPRHDLYAVGRLALTLLAGTEPDDSAAATDAIGDPILRTTVETLLRPDPADRPIDATAAAALLTGAEADEAPHTRDGDPVDVLDQLPPLPAGWTSDGPLAGRPTTPSPGTSRPRGTVVDVPPTAPAGAAGAVSTVHPAPDDVPQRGPDVAPLTATTASPLGPRTAMARVGPDPAPHRAATSPTSTVVERLSTAEAGTRRRRGALVGTAAVAVAAVTVLALVLPRLGADDPATEPPGTTGSTSTTGAPLSSPVAGTAPSTAANPTGAVITPTATVPVTSATLAAGAGCTWQQEGDRETGVDGVLVCVREGAGYAWRPV